MLTVDSLRFSGRAGLCLGVALSLLAVAPGRARADQAGEALAVAQVGGDVADHAARGREQYERGRYQDAIAEYRKAYELEADPRFLFEIAQGYRQLGLTERALFFYDRYLAARPDAPNRAEVEAIVANLERRGRVAERAPPDLGLSRDVIIVPVDTKAHAARRPLWKRWWAWALVGAAAAGVTAAAIASRSDGSTPPATDLGNARFFE